MHGFDDLDRLLQIQDESSNSTMFWLLDVVHLSWFRTVVQVVVVLMRVAIHIAHGRPQTACPGFHGLPMPSPPALCHTQARETGAGGTWMQAQIPLASMMAHAHCLLLLCLATCML